MDAPDERKWKKSNSDRIIGGVCGGLAAYFKIDATLVRILWAVSVLFHGLGGIAYLVALAVLPSDETEKGAAPVEKKSSTHVWMIFGIVLILLGLSWGLNEWGWCYNFPFWRFHWYGMWHVLLPILLIIMGILYLVYIHKDPKTEPEKTKRTHWPFYRSLNDKVIGGVCGGLARALKIDPTIVRIGIVVLALAMNVVFWAALYVIAVAIIPAE